MRRRTKLTMPGAAVVLAARSENALRDVANEIEDSGGRAHVVATDVSDWRQVQRLAQEAVRRFGSIDPWVNDASVSVYGTVEQTSIEEYERVLRVDLLGTIHGVKAALPYLIEQGGGTIINIGSIISERAVPLQSAYSAAKQGVKGFTDALRVELMREHPNIHVTLIKPASINTPFFVHARSKMGVKPAPLPPVYEPHLVAEAILFAAENPRRDIVVGGMGKMIDVSQRLSPSFSDLFMLATGFRMQKTKQPDDGVDILFKPSDQTSSTRGEWGTQSNAVSPMTRLDFYPNLQRLLTLAAVSGAVLLMMRRSER